jgi:prevent-host-death family protein
MTLHPRYEVGVRDLHDQLSEHLDRVLAGSEVVVTRRGTPIARLTSVDHDGPLMDLVRRGLVRPAKAARRSRRPRVRAKGSVSALVAAQRR